MGHSRPWARFGGQRTQACPHATVRPCLQHGVCQALSQLVVDYPVTVYSFAWTSALGSPVSSSLTLRSQASVSSSGLHEGSTGGGLLVHLVALLSPLALDLHVHQHLLTVAGHLLAGACFGCLQPQDIEAVASQDGEEPWASMRDRHLVPLLDRLFQHAMRLLNVFAHILEEQAVPTRGGLGLSGSPALSPIRRRSRGREDAPASTGNTAKAATGKPASEVASKTPVGLGHFASLPQYLKLYEVLKAAHSNYKVSLDSGSSEKFVGLLRAALVALGQLLEVAQLQDVHGHVEELLGYLRLAMAVEPLATVECVRQLLKALFGTNLTSLWEGTSEALPATLAPSTGLYHNCCSGPYAGLSKLLAGYSARSPLLTADATALGRCFFYGIAAAAVYSRCHRNFVALWWEESRNQVASKTPVGLGHFASLPQYLKLYEVLKAAHSNYKVSLDSGSSEKFVGLLRAALVALGQLLEVAQLQDVHGHVEELLGYLRLAMAVEPLATVECVRQLLKALFGTNLTSLWEGTSEALPATLAPSTGLYHNCCSGPYAGLSKLLAGYSARSPLLTADATALGSWLSWMRRGCEKKISTLLKPGSKKGKAVLAAHIRLFEPVVLQALKQYTVSSSAHLQASVLDLLAQLVHLRVNYCLLDSDQIFIGFVIKQFEFIEEGQVLHAQVLIPQIFYFLVLLSYERYHSKPIISMPEIIQLCDRLMASGQPPDKYVIPALQAIVEDLFLLPSANRTDSRKELETQREVVVSVLLRLVQYPEVLELLLAVVHHSYQEGEDRWKKFSRQLIDVILPLMSQLQVRLDNRHALNVLQRLFDSVSPSVFRPVDILLKALLVSPTEPTACFPAERWMCLVLASVRVLLAQTREEVVLSRLADLALPLRVPQALAPEALYDPLDLQSLGDNTEKAVARYLIQVVNVYGKHLCKILLQSPGAEAIFPFQQMSCLLLYLTHMFQSGSFRRVATAAMEAVHAESSAGTEVCGIEETNEHFLSLAYAYPTLTVQWCNILTLVNYGQQGFWSRLLWPTSQPLSPRRNRSTPAYSCSSELVSQAGLILLCDYLVSGVRANTDCLAQNELSRNEQYCIYVGRLI
ncbi:huntingtin isoform X1 [Ixodes scapularis]